MEVIVNVVKKAVEMPVFIFYIDGFVGYRYGLGFIRSYVVCYAKEEHENEFSRNQQEYQVSIIPLKRN